MKDLVILVDEADVETGTMEKMEAHTKGLLHRAFSVFLLNGKGEMLLQRRAETKYHSAGLWTNACCSHPRPGESLADACTRRLAEEMGMSALLSKMFSFVYHARLEHGLTEYEFDHVFAGVTDAVPQPDAAEVAEWKYVTRDFLIADISIHPECYTEWFKICMINHNDQLFNNPLLHESLPVA